MNQFEASVWFELTDLANESICMYRHFLDFVDDDKEENISVF